MAKDLKIKPNEKFPNKRNGTIKLKVKSSSTDRTIALKYLQDSLVKGNSCFLCGFMGESLTQEKI